jgi:hypothetical protein
VNPTDDPVIPDDLRDLLRSGSADLPVAPAEIRTVERRARQRRHRRRSLLAGGAAVVVLLAGAAVAQVGRAEPEHQTVIATNPPTPAADSVPQPLLLRGTPEGTALVAGASWKPGGTLLSVTSSGSTVWWRTSGEWYPVGAYELADGRRFGVATTESTGLGIPPKARLEQIGTDGSPLGSRAIPLAMPDGAFSASIRSIGVTGDEVILQRNVSRQVPIDPVSFKVATTTSYAALDVDSGAERPLFDTDEAAYAFTPATAAADVVVQAPDTRCELVVSTLDGDDPRTVPGACRKQPEGLSGYAQPVAVSPDGRYVAVVWSGIDKAARSTALLDVIDLDDGTPIVSKVLPPDGVQGLAWTGTRHVTIALDQGQPAIEIDEDGVTVRSVPWDATAGSPGD